MERKTAADYPQELLDLFDRYVHGGIDRRTFLDGAQKFATASVSAVAIWESLRPNYAWAQQVRKDDPRIVVETATIASPSGNGSIAGVLARPAKSRGKRPGVLVVHENRGLNPYIEDVARRLAVEGYTAFAPDGLTSKGGYPGDDEKGAALFREVDRAKMTEWGAGRTWRPGFRSTVGKLPRPMSRGSRRRCCCSTRQTTSASTTDGLLTNPPSRKTRFPTRRMCIREPTTGSTTTRRRATTTRRRNSRGSAPSRGSESISNPEAPSGRATRGRGWTWVRPLPCFRGPAGTYCPSVINHLC